MSNAAFGDSGWAKNPVLGTWATGDQIEGESTAQNAACLALLYSNPHKLSLYTLHVSNSTHGFSGVPSRQI